jgi:hypothetical protein
MKKQTKKLVRRTTKPSLKKLVRRTSIKPDTRVLIALPVLPNRNSYLVSGRVQAGLRRTTWNLTDEKKKAMKARKCVATAVMKFLGLDQLAGAKLIPV